MAVLFIFSLYRLTEIRLVGQEPQRITRNTAYHGNLVATRSKIDIRSNFFTNRSEQYSGGLEQTFLQYSYLESLESHHKYQVSKIRINVVF